MARSESTRRKIHLATIATAVGIITSFVTIALGAFDLREKVSSVDANDVTVSSSEYVRGVAEVCDEREDAQARRRADALRLKRRMKNTRSFPRQRILLLEAAKRELDRADHPLAALGGLEPPSEVASRHRAVVRLWARNVARIRDHRDRLEASTTRTRLVSALIHMDRSVMETDARRVDAGLLRLGRTACDIGPRAPIPVITLPPPEQAERQVEDQPALPSTEDQPALPSTEDQPALPSTEDQPVPQSPDVTLPDAVPLDPGPDPNLPQGGEPSPDSFQPMPGMG